MLFNVEKTINCVRLGLVHGIERLPGFSLETPNLLVYMKGGVIPYLTPDTFEEINKENGILHFPVPAIMHCRETIKTYNKGIGEFVAMPNYLMFTSLVDSGVKRVPGSSKHEHIHVWSKNGKMYLNEEMYLDLMEDIKPDFYLVISDNDTDITSSKKRICKSLERTLTFFRKYIELHNSSEKLKNSKIIGSLVGGFNVQAREKCSSIIGSSPVFGVSIDGLHDCSNQVSSIDFELIRPVVEASLRHVTSEKLRICHGSWNPKVVLDLISLGIDIFDTSLPCMLAEDGGALTFVNDETSFETRETMLLTPNGKTDEFISVNNCFSEPLSKKSKTDISNFQFHISLKDKKYAESFEPISTHCNCLTCKNHTKAYIHHLLNVKEILGTTLLMIHNLHHYFHFFQTIRTALKKEKFGIMRSNFEKMFGNDIGS